MTFADGAHAQNEATPARRRRRLIGMVDDAGIEQRRRFEGILVEEIRTDELTLLPGERRVRRKRIFHLIGARFERLDQVAVTRLKVLEDLRQLLLGHRPERARAPDPRCDLHASCPWR